MFMRVLHVIHTASFSVHNFTLSAFLNCQRQGKTVEWGLPNNVKHKKNQREKGENLTNRRKLRSSEDKDCLSALKTDKAKSFQ